MPENSDDDLAGFVYVTEIARTPGVVKIGHSKTALDRRLSGLNHTGVLGRHEFVYWCKFEDCVWLEQTTHQTLSGARDHGEFFRVPAVVARRTIRETVAHVGMTLLSEWSDEKLDRNDAVMIRRQLETLEAEFTAQGKRADTWNPFLRGRAVQAWTRQRDLSEQMELLRRRLEMLGEE
jgi:hypothetical protein